MTTKTAVLNVRPAHQTLPVEIHNPLQYMYDNGIVFELNRSFFHPIGLSVAVQPVDGQNPRRGLRLALFDCSANPTLTFSPSDFERGRNKWKTWWKSVGSVNHQLRRTMLGIVAQILPNYHDQPFSKN